MTYKFANDFFYFTVRPDTNRGTDVLICCSGVNLDRFAPLTRGRHGLAVSPSMRGLQNTRNAISSLALEKGARPRFIRGRECAGIAPTKESWYTDLLVIENAPGPFSEEIIRCGVAALVESIFRACRIHWFTLRLFCFALDLMTRSSPGSIPRIVMVFIVALWMQNTMSF